MNCPVQILRFLATSLLCVAMLSLPARAQDLDAALLVADRVLITEDERLVATSNVEAFYDGIRLFTDEIIYDQKRDELIINSPVRLSQKNGDVMIADSADLDSKLENGILRGARYVLDQELQILSAQTDRVEGRYTVLRKVIATSCQICGTGIPIWQIRADRTVHDREEKQIYFRRAQFRLLGVPVLYLPTMRIPDPSLKRTTGFIIPKFVSNTVLGFGVKVPYFITLGDHADVTITPYVSPVTSTVELRFRKMFRHGYLELNGAVSQDTVLPDVQRHYLTGFARFDLGQGVKLDFDLETASDGGYRSLYGYSGKDRLGSGITLSRVKRNVFFQAELLNYETLRDNESNKTQPTLIGNVTYERRYQPSRLDGETRALLVLHGHKRVSHTDVIGRDMAKINFDLSWRDEWTVGDGIRLGLLTSLGVESQTVVQDSTARGRTVQTTPAIGATLRYPLHSTSSDGSRYLIEPLAQIGWVDGSPSILPNDENISTDFDEGNLLSLPHFPTKEWRETGVIGALGARWERFNPETWSAGVTVGQIFRDTMDPAFLANSGLKNQTYNRILAMHFTAAWGGFLQARGLFDRSFETVKAEARVGYAHKKLSVSGTYVQLDADADENLAASVAEWSLSGTYKINKHWTANGNVQYDLITDRAAKTGGGLNYKNECVTVGFGATRSFARSTTLVPATTYELSVSLLGFSTGGSGKSARRTCRK
ncbi:LPS assembly protein LptD [Planktotalea sp.]|uniref:LPS-assembly protein LptD n=1 Tax=Planktotalea sp. TaxID=2029877 RepID=UPI0025E38788|nr:LPS assembly protein LptD [Planktotalea sp.]